MNMQVNMPKIGYATLAMLRPGQDYPDGNINARLTYTEAEIDELAASLMPDQDGQLRPMLVATHPKKPGVFFTFGGGRRRIAYERLIDQGKLPKDHPIEIKDHGHIKVKDALSKSMADNAAVPMHPADQAVTFAKLAENKSPEDIARDRGMTIKAVCGLIALGQDLAPEVLKSWREGKITREAVQTLVLADKKAQRDALEDVEQNEKNPYGHTLRDLRAGIMRNKESAMTRLLGFVGVPDARANGIQVIEDFFGKGGVVKDLRALEKVADKKMAALVKVELEAGWSWAEGKITMFRHMHHGMGEQKVTPGPLTPDEEKRLTYIDTRLKLLRDIDFKTDLEDREQDRLEQEREDMRIAAKERAFTDKQRKSAGVIIRLREDGSVFYQRGLIRKAEKKSAKKKASAGGPAQPKEQEPITADVRGVMQDWHNEAMAALLEKKPREAAVIYVASLYYEGMDNVCEIDAWNMPGKSRDLVGLIAKFGKMKDAQLVQALMPAVTKSIQVGENDGTLHKGAVALLKIVGEAEYQAAIAKKFAPKVYFEGASKKHILGVMAEAFGAAARRDAEDKGDAALQAIMIKEIGKTGWLPVELRTKAYKGPTAKAPAKGGK